MPLLEVKNLRTWFPVTGGVLRRHVDDVKAVDDVSFTIEPGTTVGLVGLGLALALCRRRRARARRLR